MLNEKGKEEWEKFVRIEEKAGVDDEDDGTCPIQQSDINFLSLTSCRFPSFRRGLD